MGSADGSPARRLASQEDALLRALRHCARTGEVAGVVRLVERWAETGPLPREAALAQARALLSLRLMDRAWVRLKELTDADPDDVDALVLTAEMYIERGWPARAKKPLERLVALGASHASIPTIQAAADQPPLEPPANAREIEREGTPEQLVALAERFLATGSHLRARGILERIRRMAPGHARAELLLWGLEGDFSARGRTPLELAGELLARDEAGDLDTAEHTDVGEESTGSVELPTTEVAVPESAAAPFPSLFRRPGRSQLDLDDEDDDDEPTVTALLASTEELREPPSASATDHGAPAAERGGDTAIMAIIPRAGGGVGLSPIDGPSHKARPDAPKMRETLDLKAWQRSMGIDPGTDEVAEDEAPRGRDEDFLEEEDQEVVVMTRRERPAEPAPTSTPASRKPLEVIEKHPKPMYTPVPIEPESEVQLDSDDLIEEPAPPSAPLGPGRLLGVVLLTAGLLIVFGLGALRVLQSAVEARVFASTQEAIGSLDPARLSEQLRAVEEEVHDGRPPLAARRVALAQLSAVAWHEFEGGAARREQTARLIAEATQAGADEEQIALAAALMWLGEGDLATAARQSEAAGRGSELARDTAARVAMAQGRADLAIEIWDEAPPTSLRSRALRPIALAAQRAPDAASAGAEVLAQAPDSPAVAVLALEQGWGGADPTQRLAAADALAARELPPRLAARVAVLRHDLLRERGDLGGASEALEEALRLDGTYTPALYRRAADALVENRVVEAALLSAACLDARTYDAPCLRAEVQALLDLDRGEEAAARAASAATAGLGDLAIVLGAWTTAAQGDIDSARAALAAVEPARQGRYGGLARYVEGVALVALGAQDAEQSLNAAVEALSGTGDPLDRVLAARAAAARAEIGPPDDVPARLREAFQLASLDPEVHVRLGRAYAARGERERADYHFRRAVELGAEHGGAWLARADWAAGDGRRADAHAALERYLTLGPTGMRAAAARQRLGQQ